MRPEFINLPFSGGACGLFQIILGRLPKAKFLYKTRVSKNQCTLLILLIKIFQIRMPSSMLFCPSGNRQRCPGVRPPSLSHPRALILGGCSVSRGELKGTSLWLGSPLLRARKGRCPAHVLGVWAGAWPTLAHSELLVKDVKPVNLQSRS